MNLITGWTDDTIQTQSILMPDNSVMSLTIQYLPQQQGWFIQNLTWGNYTIEGRRITSNPNLLFQFDQIYTFGLACFTMDNFDPTQQGDFLSGYASLYTMSQAEVLSYNELLETQTS